MDKIRRRNFGEISIEYKLMKKGTNMNSFHSHNSYEILFIASGSKIILCNDSYQELHAGDIALFSPNEPHKSFGNNSYEWICLNFSEEYLKKYFTPTAAKTLISIFQNRIVRSNTNQFVELCRMFYKLYNNYNNKSDMLFIDVANILLYISKINKSILKNNLVNKKLSEIINYISENYLYNISIENIADNCHISKSWICTLFKKNLKTTPMSFLSNIRILHACDILLTTDMTITEIAMNCGFSSSSYFGHIFKLITGQTPSEFRQSKK